MSNLMEIDWFINGQTRGYSYLENESSEMFIYFRRLENVKQDDWFIELIQRMEIDTQIYMQPH
jgi:hypothetical protein